MKKQQKKTKADQVRVTLRMSEDVWREARHAALDQNVPFGRYVEAALVAYRGGKS
jgi:hypothetical protein